MQIQVLSSAERDAILRRYRRRRALDRAMTVALAVLLAAEIVVCSYLVVYPPHWPDDSAEEATK